MRTVNSFLHTKNTVTKEIAILLKKHFQIIRRTFLFLISRFRLGNTALHWGKTPSLTFIIFMSFSVNVDGT